MVVIHKCDIIKTSMGPNKDPLCSDVETNPNMIMPKACTKVMAKNIIKYLENLLLLLLLVDRRRRLATLPS